MMGVKNFKETKVYNLAFEVAMEIFEISKTFPKEEILYQKPLMLTRKIVKLEYGLISRLLANILVRKNIKFYQIKIRKQADYWAI